MQSIKIGFIQCIAMIPGVSRSGATIMGAMALGVDRRTAAEFSFFLALPTMTGRDGARSSTSTAMRSPDRSARADRSRLRRFAFRRRDGGGQGFPRDRHQARLCAFCLVSNHRRRGGVDVAGNAIGPTRTIIPAQ
jgi:hypothetical protein